MNERETLVATIRDARNLNVAANRLNVSRRTLQNRMREYNLPRSKGGRPRSELGSGGGGALSTLAVGVLVLGGGFLLGRWMSRGSTDKQVITGAAILGAL